MNTGSGPRRMYSDEERKARRKASDLAYYYRNQETRKAYASNWNKSHRPHINKLQNNRYHASDDAKKQRYLDNKAWRKKNPEQYKIQMAKFRRDNREKCRLVGLTYRSKKKGSPGYDYTTGLHILWRKQMYGFKCWMCGGVATAIDHVKPISKGGAHWPCNLRPACKPCNTGKKDRWPFNVYEKNITQTPGNDERQVKRNLPQVSGLLQVC